MRIARLAVTAVATAALAIPFAAAPGVAQTASAGSSPWLNTSSPLEKRVDLLLKQMTNEEKATLMTSVAKPTGSHATGYIPGIERLGIPGLQFTDGPGGVRDGQPETALPSPVSLAASFNTDTAKAYGTVMGTARRP
jgi:beta-glucosidase